MFSARVSPTVVQVEIHDIGPQRQDATSWRASQSEQFPTCGTMQEFAICLVLEQKTQRAELLATNRCEFFQNELSCQKWVKTREVTPHVVLKQLFCDHLVQAHVSETEVKHVTYVRTTVRCPAMRQTRVAQNNVTSEES